MKMERTERTRQSRHRGFWRRLFFRLTALVLIVGMLSAHQTFANDEIKKKERELEERKNELKELRAQLKDNKYLQHETNKKISETNLEIQVLEGEIELLSLQISETEAAILVKIDELAEAEDVLERKKLLLNDRLRVMYKTSYVGYAEVLFGAESFHDLLSRVDMLQRILDHDQQLVVSLKEQRDLIEQKKVELENKKSELTELVKGKIEKQDSLKAAVERLTAYTRELIKNFEALKEQEDKLVADADALTRDIKNLKLREQYVGGEFVWPVPGNYKLSDDFGTRIHPITGKKGMHTGIDIPAKKGSPVVAAQTGNIVDAKWRGTYGLAVLIDHGGGILTLYAHLSKISVKVGQVVQKGTKIGEIGSTGYSTGPHLHFEVRKGGTYVDPKPYLKGKNQP